MAASNGPFSRRYYHQAIDHSTHYRGLPIIKCPFDLWNYQEIIFETKPTLIIETGAFLGASALYLADTLSLLPDGPRRVISVEIDASRKFPEHDAVQFWVGASSTSPSVLEALHEEAKGERVMVILDSDHSQGHVLGELRLYAPLVSTGCYLVVEDTNADAYPTGPYREPGPLQALKAWQPTNRGFEVDRHRERFGFTCHPGGYLRKKG